MRCLTLADELQRCGIDAVFVCRKFDGDLISFIGKRGYTVVALEQPVAPNVGLTSMDPPHAQWLEVSWQHDAEETIQLLKQKCIDIDLVIVDHYALDYRWHRFFRQYTKKLMVIDDLADRRLDCDLLLDQTYGREECDYLELVPDGCKLLLGTKYCLLRPQFVQKRREAIERRAMKSGIHRILVCMGGSDPDNVSSVVLAGLEKVYWQNIVEIDVVLGRSAPYLAEVKEKASRSALDIQVHSDVENMAELILEADLGIGAGGTTSWERCCLGLPTFTLITAANQQRVVEGLCTAGATMSSSQISSDMISAGVKKMISDDDVYQKFATHSFAVTDGKGGEKVVRTMVENMSRIILRTVLPGDCEQIFKWQTTPGIRKFCRNPNVPTKQEHERWFYAGLQDTNRELIIVKFNGEPVGLLRLDTVESDDNTFEVSVLIAQEWQGKGIALDSLLQLRCLRTEEIFLAEILEGNTASIRLFISAGFKKVDERWYENIPKGDREAR